jgi:hypothetical protein
MKNSISRSIIRYLSQLLKSLWLFFPAILFLLFPISCFWSMGQGKDIMIAFIKQESSTTSAFHFNYARIIFFIAISFWIYVSWYSSRIISYIKKTRQQQDIESIASIDREQSENYYSKQNSYFEIGQKFLDAFPRMIGHSCFLVLELALFQLPVLSRRISPFQALLIFIAGLVGLHFFNKWIENRQAGTRSFTKTFFALLYVFAGAVVFICFLTRVSIWIFFLLLLLLHIIFIYYINLRRQVMEINAASKQINEGLRRTLLEKLMDFFCIPRKESGYFRSFLIVCGLGILLYSMGIFWLAFARSFGPFPFIIMAFAVLLAFGNVVTAFSVRHKVNYHFILLLIAFLLQFRETHYLRTVELTSTNNYKNKPDLKKYLTAWVNERMDTTQSRYDMYFIMANGGASRSGYWTAAVLGNIEDASLLKKLPTRFSDHIFCLSGTSGGGVGVATFFSMLRNKQTDTAALYAASAREFLKQDYFTYTVARMLGPDFFNYIFHVPFVEDRAGALESSFEMSSLNKPEGLYEVPFYDKFSNFPAMKAERVFLPILFVNTTRMQDGNPGVVSNLMIDPTFNNRVDVVQLLDSNRDMSITSSSILGARFPYLSPAGRIKDSYFVDGGYFDNSGAGAVQEMIRGVINISKADSSLRDRINRINFKVLHIVNSPTGFESAIKKVPSITNDLMSPILTITGAYDMQTTVNDKRLMNYIKDIAADNVNGAAYTQISLYLTPEEIRNQQQNNTLLQSEPPYAMNWFMSDTTRRRIEVRLNSNPQLISFIQSMR